MARHGARARPAVPPQIRAAFADIRRGHLFGAQNQLHVEVELRTDVHARELTERLERVAARQESFELRVGKRANADAELALHVPDTLADHHADADLIVAA